MPTTMSSILIIVFAILPGWPAFLLYKKINGSKWNESEWIQFVNIVGLSLLGLILYNLFFPLAKFPPPIYILPNTFTLEGFKLSILPSISISLITHTIFSLVSSFLIALVIRWFSGLVRSSVYPSAWDEFIRVNAKKHWVIVSLNNGDAYAGYISDANCSVPSVERDIVLNEPAKYDETEGNYFSLAYQNLYLSSESIISIATIFQEGDSRLSPIAHFLFEKESRSND